MARRVALQYQVDLTVFLFKDVHAQILPGVLKCLSLQLVYVNTLRTGDADLCF